MSGFVVSGSTTPLGRRVVEALVAQGGGPVLAVGVEPDDEVEGLFPTDVRWQQVDLTRPRAVRRLLYGPVRSLGLTTVIHLAAHRDAWDEGRRAHRLHVDGTRLLLRLAEEHPSLRRFVHLSTASVYRNRTDMADVLREDAPLDLSADRPQAVRDRVEADVTVCSRMGLTDLQIAVLRTAEILAPDMGSQLWDFLEARLCVRPAGFDPMTEVLSLHDATAAILAAAGSDAVGVFNVPGADVLPLSNLIALWGRTDVSLPGPLVGPAHRLWRRMSRQGFRWDLNKHRFHFNAVLDGTRAHDVLGYTPQRSALTQGR